MCRYLTWTGKKAHRIGDAERVWVESLGLKGLSALCGQWVGIERKAKRGAPRCLTCERIAVKREAAP